MKEKDTERLKCPRCKHKVYRLYGTNKKRLHIRCNKCNVTIMKGTLPGATKPTRESKEALKMAKIGEEQTE